MALSPSIPTSFVPKQPVSTTRRKYSGGNNIILIVSFLIALIAAGTAAGVFLYAQYLTSVENTKANELIAAQSTANPSTVQSFIRLSDRLTAAKSIMNQHIELSQFFTLLDSVTVQNVHFDSLQITVADDRSAQIEMSGEAQDFNTLAVESNVFAAQKDIKSAIFSGINIDPKTNQVSFTLSANLDPGIVVEAAAPTSAAIIAASSTPVTVATSSAAVYLPSTPSSSGLIGTSSVATTPAKATTPVKAIVPATPASTVPATPVSTTTTP